MQKLILTGALCLLVSGLQAQPWMTAHDGKESLKLQDIVNAHNANPGGMALEDEEEETGREQKGLVKEGKDYLFDRWKWYMEQHTDANGNLVSPAVKNYQELQAYKARHAANAANYKGTANASNWTFVGPKTSNANGAGIGRIQKISFHPTDSNTFWVGTAGGGAWKTTTNGTTWTCMTDGLPTLGAADITINPRNPNTIYLCTGDRDATDNYSVGVLKSTDGGVTWNSTGLQFTYTQFRVTTALVINKLDTSSLTVATTAGIYKSYDAGATWTLTRTGSFKDLLYRPNDTSVMYATGSVGSGSPQIYRSINGGASFSQVTSITGGPRRISIAVTPANPNMVKAIVANANDGLEGIYNSSDTGKTFTKVFNPANCSQNLLANRPNPSSSSCDGQGWYDLAIAISPIDSNRVAIGGINTYYSTTGGASWTLANQWSGFVPGIRIVHADKHYLTFQPLRPTVLFEANDGGVYNTLNLASNVWNDLTNGLGITQFYRIAVASHSATVIGGAQDNGSKRIGVGTVPQELTGGDGMNCEYDPFDPSTVYTAMQYGTIWRNGSNISNNIPGGQPTGDWITPYVVHPRDNSRVVAGFDKMYLSTDQGASWSQISNVFGSGTKIKRVAFAPSSLLTVYAVANNQVRVTTDNGANWTSVLGSPGATISDIIIDKKDKLHFWVTYSGYGAGSKVAEYDSTNGWQSISGTLPDVPANCIMVDSFNGTKYVGTDLGVYYRDTTMTDWAPWNTNMPIAHVTDMGINYSTGEIWASTYGRGMWKSAKFDFPAPNAVATIVPFAADVITISPNPTSGSFDIQTSNTSLMNQSATVNIVDMAGRTVWNSTHAFSAGGVLHVNAAGLAHATYIVDVTAQNGVRAKAKMVVN